MNTKSPRILALACLLSWCLAVPLKTSAEPQTPGQRAGEVSRVIPAVSIARGAKSMNASAKTIVDWQDVLNTQANARARVSLDDGSVMNVGSDSSVHVTKHDVGAQQTELELSFGKMRTQAQKITQPNGKFEVKTAAGVAGVVGTDFYVSYDNNVMTVMVFEGIVKVCNLAGVCVEVKAGQMTTVRNGDSSAPAVPAQANLSMLTDAVNSTNLGSGPGVQQVHHIGKGTAIAIAVLAAIPLVVIPVVATRSSSTVPTPPVVTGCKPGSANC
jgi:ferric-dicitrate binding protein FerR (iron transport regulator)